MNTIVNFETAKLLKKKKFGLSEDDYIQLPRFYEKDGDYVEYSVYVGRKYNPHRSTHLGADTIADFEARLTRLDNSLDNIYLAPTIGDVVIWLYEKHGIWISVYEYKDHAADVNDPFVFRTNRTGNKEFKSPTEAYESSIKYILNKLI